MALGDEAAKQNTRGDRRTAQPVQVPVQPAKTDDTTPASKED